MTDHRDHDTLTLQIVSTLDDHVALALYVGSQPPFNIVRRRFEVTALLCTPVIMLVVFLANWALDRNRVGFGTLMHELWATRLYVALAVGGGVALMALCLLGSRLTRRWWIKVNLRRVFRARPDVDANDPTPSYRAQVTFDRDGVGFASPTGVSRVNWTAITCLDETPDYFFLIGPSLTAFSVAKRTMTAAQVDQLRDLIAGYAPQAVQRPAGAGVRSSNG